MDWKHVTPLFCSALIINFVSEVVFYHGKKTVHSGERSSRTISMEQSSQTIPMDGSSVTISRGRTINEDTIRNPTEVPAAMQRSSNRCIVQSANVDNIEEDDNTVVRAPQGSHSWTQRREHRLLPTECNPSSSVITPIVRKIMSRKSSNNLCFNVCVVIF